MALKRLIKTRVPAAAAAKTRTIVLQIIPVVTTRLLVTNTKSSLAKLWWILVARTRVSLIKITGTR